MKARESKRRPPLRRPRKAEIGNAEEMQDEDLELEKVRLISLALECGFDEDSAKTCLNRLVELYGKPSIPYPSNAELVQLLLHELALYMFNRKKNVSYCLIMKRFKLVILTRFGFRLI